MEKATPEFEILGQMINRSEGPRVGGRIRSNPRNPDAGNVKSEETHGSKPELYLSITPNKGP